jgi:hypothetical protein
VSKLRILAWVIIAAAIMCWPTRPTGFNARWVNMPPSMSLETFQAARKLSAQPSFCAYAFQIHWHTGQQCRIG